MSFHSLTATTWGAAACVPWVMFQAGMWTREARNRFPVLEELKKAKADIAGPLIKNMTKLQVEHHLHGWMYCAQQSTFFC